MLYRMDCDGVLLGVVRCLTPGFFGDSGALLRPYVRGAKKPGLRVAGTRLRCSLRAKATPWAMPGAVPSDTRCRHGFLPTVSQQPLCMGTLSTPNPNPTQVSRVLTSVAFSAFPVVTLMEAKRLPRPNPLPPPLPGHPLAKTPSLLPPPPPPARASHPRPCFRRLPASSRSASWKAPSAASTSWLRRCGRLA